MQSIANCNKTLLLLHCLSCGTSRSVSLDHLLLHCLSCGTSRTVSLDHLCVLLHQLQSHIIGWHLGATAWVSQTLHLNKYPHILQANICIPSFLTYLAFRPASALIPEIARTAVETQRGEIHLAPERVVKKQPHPL